MNSVMGKHGQAEVPKEKKQITEKLQASTRKAPSAFGTWPWLLELLWSLLFVFCDFRAAGFFGPSYLSFVISAQSDHCVTQHAAM
jgi:hypothetical protein